MTGAQVNKCLIWVIGTASLQPNINFGYIRSQREADIVANCGMTWQLAQNRMEPTRKIFTLNWFMDVSAFTIHPFL